MTRSDSSARTSPPWDQTLLVFALFALLYALTASGHLSTPDEELMFRTTESMATRFEFSIEPLADESGGGFASRRGVNGREYAQYGLANPAAAVPLYWIGAAAARLVTPEAAERRLAFRTTLLHPAGRPAGPELVKRFVVSFQGALVSALLCALMWRFAYRVAETPGRRDGRRGSFVSIGRHLSPSGAAWLTALAFGAGTMAWPHARTFFSEPLAALFMLAAFYVAAGSGPTSPSRALAAGGFFALALFTRLDSVFLLPGLGLLIALRHLETDRSEDGEAAAEMRTDVDPEVKPPYVQEIGEGMRRLLSPRFLTVAAAAALPLIAFGVVQLAMNSVLYGGATQSAYSDQTEGIRFSTPLLAGLYGFLFSAGKSALLFSPALLLGAAGWRALGRRDASLAIGLGTAALLGLLIHARWQNWSGGWDWGPRHIYQLHAFALVPAAAMFAECWSRLTRWTYAAVMAPAAAVQIYGTSQHPVDFYTLYYRLPLTRPKATSPIAPALYSPGEAVALATRMGLRDAATGGLRDDTFWPPTAPINDTIYVPQNGVWYRYAEMWDRGYTDNVWHRLWLRERGMERELR